MCYSDYDGCYNRRYTLRVYAGYYYNNYYYPKAAFILCGQFIANRVLGLNPKDSCGIRHLNFYLMKKKDWLKLKGYTHITPKFNHQDKSWIRSYVKDKSKIRSHRFYPMIHYTICEAKFKRPIVDGKKNYIREADLKRREIFYSNHLDGQIYSYYAHLLNDLLEKEYENSIDLFDSVIAYRRIPFNKVRNKCNIDFANEIFSYIRDSDKRSLTAISVDVSKYFDTIDHRVLKKKWSEILNRIDLPKDHYKIFRSITNYAFIEIGDLLDLSPHCNFKKLSLLKEADLDGFFKNGNEFRKLVEKENVIRVNRDKKGIPQGSPISAVLSNLYLIDFDNLMVKLAKSYNGIYRRYSDDIIFVCDPIWVNKINDTIRDSLADLGLEIQDKKTQKVYFERESPKVPWKIRSNEYGSNSHTKPLTYLCFEFDGRKIRLRQKGISSYYRKLKRIIGRAAFFAKKTKNAQTKGKSMDSDPWIYRTKIYRLKTHLGSKQKSIKGRVFWGNYLSYVYNASEIMNEPAIRQQLRNHWRITEREINNFNENYDLEKSNTQK